jgi:hypothetical protein
MPARLPASSQADMAADQPLFELLLPGPYLPFYLQWSPCGSYLALLSNWPGQRVGLRVVDVAAGLGPQGGRPRMCHVGCARPLFLAWAPARPQLLVHHGMMHHGIWDAAAGGRCTEA